MNALLNVLIRIRKHGAQNLTQVTAQVEKLRTTASAGMAAAGVAMANFGRAAGAGVSPLRTLIGTAQEGMRSFQNFGKNITWTGRQLTMFFTLPILGAAAAGYKLWKGNEEAFTRLKKVYNATIPDANKELELHRKILEELSNQYGILQEDVITAAATFAQAGAAGVGLDRLTKSAIEFSLLADQDLVESTRQIILMMGQFGLTTDEAADPLHQLSTVIAQLNIVENETQVSMKDLLDVIERSGSAAATAGLSVGELAAVTAAFVNIAGNAATGGTFLRTAIFRLMDPMRDGAKVLRQLGFDIDAAAWRSKDFAERLAAIGEQWSNLTQPQKLEAADALFGIRQGDKGIAMIEDQIGAFSRYRAALEKVQNLDLAQSVMVDELKILLESDPRKFEIALTGIKNALADLFITAMPVILGLLQAAEGFMNWLKDLDPQTRKVIMVVMALVAALGPLSMSVGGVVLAITTLSQGLLTISKFLVSPAGGIILLTALIVALGVAIYLNRDKFVAAFEDIRRVTASGTRDIGEWFSQLWQDIRNVTVNGTRDIAQFFVDLWDDIRNTTANGVADIARFFVDLWNSFVGLIKSILTNVRDGFISLRELFESGLRAILDTVVNFVRAIAEGLSYLNPWAEHSPSLVSQVDSGIDAIINKYDELTRIREPLQIAADAMRKFMAETADLRNMIAALEVADERATVAKYAPAALDSFDQIQQSIVALRVELEALEPVIARQEEVVRGLENALDDLDRKVEEAEEVLSSLQDNADSISDALSAAQDRLQTLADTPITGMRAMSDAIFENEMAVNALRLAIMDFEDANPEVADLTDQFALLNGEIENLRAREKELQLAGAGGDILGPLKAQADALEAQREAMMTGGGAGGPADELQRMREELERLQREGERLNLQESLQFDPLTRQIEQLVEGMNEMPFDEIVAGIQREQANIVSLTAQHDQATAAVREQEKVVDDLRRTRETLSDQLELEKDKLQDLETMYSTIERSIGDLTSGIRELTTAAEKASKALDDVLGGAGDFETGMGPGGGLGAVGTYEDMQKFYEDLMKDTEFEDPFAGFRKNLEDFGNWWSEKWNRLKEIASISLMDLFPQLWDWIKGEADEFWGKITGFFGDLWHDVSTVTENGTRDILNWFKDLWDDIKTVTENGVRDIVQFFRDLPGGILAAIGSFASLLTKNGTELLSGLANGILNGWTAVNEWFTLLPSVIGNFFVNVHEWLVEAGRALMRGLGAGIYEIWLAIAGFFDNIWITFRGWFNNARDWLVDAGERIIEGLYNGIVNAPFDIMSAIIKKVPFAEEVIRNLPGGGLGGDVFEKYNIEGRHWGGVEGIDRPQMLSRPYGAQTDEYWRLLRKNETVFTPGQMQVLGNVLSRGGGTASTVNIYGNLEFPNITSGDDAELFVANLETLASTS